MLICTRRSALIAAWVVLAITSITYADDPVQQYRQAAREYAQGHWKFAAVTFQGFLRDHPQNPRAATARFFLAESLVQLGEFEQAHEHFVQFIADAPKHRYAKQAHFRRGESSYLANAPRVAKRELTQFRDKFPEHPLNQFALSYLGELALKEKRFPVARKYFNDAIREFPKGVRRDHCRLGLGRSFAEEGKLTAAQPFFENLSTQSKGALKHEGRLRLGMLLFEQEKYAQAGKLLEQLIKESSSHRAIRNRGQFWLAKSLLADGKPTQAVNQFEQLPLAQLDEEMAAAATLMVADAHRNLGNYTEARQWYKKIWRRHATSQWAATSLIGRMRIAIKTSNFDELQVLVQQFEKSFRTHPKWNEVRQLIGQSYIRQRRFDEAISLFQSLVKSSPKQSPKALKPVAQVGHTTKRPSPRTASARQFTIAENQYYLALAQLKSGKTKSALQTLTKVITKSLPENLAASIAVTRAAALVTLKQYKAAIQPLRDYLAHAPIGEHAAKCRAQLVVMLAHQGQVNDARKTLLELEEKHPKELKLRLEATQFLAEIAYAKKDRDLAKQLYTRLSEKGNPDKYVEQGIAGLAWAVLADEKLAESADAFEDLLRRFPNSPLAAQAALMRANMLERMKQFDAALSAYLLVVEKYSQSRQIAAAKLGAGRLLAKRKQYVQASKLLESITKDHPRFSHMDAALYEWAWVLADTQRSSDSQRVFQRISQDYPQSRFWSDASYRVAEHLSRTKKRAAATKLLNQVVRSKTESKIRLHALFLAGQLYAANSDWSDVLGVMNKIVDGFPLSPLRLSAEYWIAEAKYRLGQFDDAAAQFRQVKRQAQGRKVAWLPMVDLRQAQILAQKKEWTQAYLLARDVITNYPSFSRLYEVHYLIGRCQASRGQYLEARASYQSVIGAGKNTETAALAQWMIGETYFHQKKYSQAIDAYQKVISVYQFPRWQSAALLQTGKCLEVEGKWKSATQAYAQILKEFSKTRFARDARTRLRVVRERAALASLPTSSIK